MELSELLERQRAFFAAGTTRPLKFRMEALERLGTALSDWEDELARALMEEILAQVPVPVEDFGKRG